jgi:signal transduction histidine kinase
MASLDIARAAGNLKDALQNNDGEAAAAGILEIDKAVTILQRVDSELSSASQKDYFLLFFFLSLLVIGAVLALTALRSRLEKETALYQQSAAFSRRTILAQEQERERIARELHDTVAQDLLRLSFQTETIEETEDRDQRGRLCAEVVSGQKEIMRRIRTICENLIPPDFQHGRLIDALQTLCHKFEQRTGITCRFILRDDIQFDALDSDQQLHCFRIVQESLTNIEKHAEAGEVSVTAGNTGADEIYISVSDNGRGIRPGQKTIDRDICRDMPARGRFGLWNMFERAESLNAVLEIESGKGTTVTVRIPAGGSNS